jgi:hypothetical protein
MYANPGGTISLRADANGDIVTAENAGASPLIANRTAIGPRESFDMIANADGTVSLRLTCSTVIPWTAPWITKLSLKPAST